MTVLTALQGAAVVIGLEKPTAVFPSSEREHVELQWIANEMATRINRAHEWSAAKAVAAFAGDGSTTDYALPADYGRMLRDGEIVSSDRPGEPLEHIVDHSMWLADIVSGETPENPQWTIYGGLLHVNPAPAVGELLKFFYVKAQPEITDDTATVLFPERLLTLAVIWRWRAYKGMPYAEDMTDYELALADAVRDDMGPGIFDVGSNKTRVTAAWTGSRDVTP